MKKLLLTIWTIFVLTNVAYSQWPPTPKANAAYEKAVRIKDSLRLDYLANGTDTIFLVINEATGVVDSISIFKLRTLIGGGEFTVDLTTNDGTGVFQVTSTINQTTQIIGYYDTVGQYFSTQPPIYLVNTGQSNATPRADGSPVDTVGPKNMTIFDPVLNRWTLVNTQNAWYGNEGNNWYPIHFAKEALLDNRIVKVVHAAEGGRPIDDWLTLVNTNGNTYLRAPAQQWDSLTNRITRSNLPKIDLITWYQGETDGILGRTDRLYGRDFYTVMEQFSDLPTFYNGTKLIAVQVLPDTTATTEEEELFRWDNANSFFKYLNQDYLDWTFTIPTKKEYAAADAIHLSPTGCIEIGKTLYNTYTNKIDYSLFRGSAKAQLADSVRLSFTNNSIYIDDVASTILGYTGTWGAWASNIFINDNTKDGVTFNPNFCYCIDTTGYRNIKTIRGNFSTSAWLQQDSLILANCPNDYDTVVNAPLGVANVFAWYDAAQQTGLSNGSELTTLNDFSGNSRDMPAPVAGADWFADCTGKGNPCLQFNGIDEYYEFDADTSFRFTYKDSSTIFAMYALEAGDTLRALWGGGLSSGYDGYCYYFTPTTNPPRFQALIGGNSTVASTNNGSVLQRDTVGFMRLISLSVDPANPTPVNKFVINRTDGSGIGNSANLLANTNVQFSNNTASNAPDFDATVNVFRIGDHSQTTVNVSQPWKGKLYEMIIFDRILSNEEVTLMYNYFGRKYNKQFFNE